MQKQDKQRDEYINIKSKVEADNAPIIRQIALVDQKIGYLNSKKAAVFAQISQLKAQMAKDQSLKDFDEKKKTLKQELKEKERALESLQQQFGDIKKA